VGLRNVTLSDTNAGWLAPAMRAAALLVAVAAGASGLVGCSGDGDHAPNGSDAAPDGSDGEDNEPDGGSQGDGDADTGDAADIPRVIGGVVSGLEAGATLVLQNNDSDNVTITENGAFQFAQLLDSGADYQVSVFSDPALPSQSCTVMDGSGTVAAADVASVVVTCVTNSFVIGGSVTGLSGAVILQNNAGDDLTLTVDGTFAFETPVLSGASYAVTIVSQPAGDSCSISGAAGTVGGADVQSIAINCAAGQYTVGGSISGLEGGTVILANNAGDELAVSANGGFAFATPLADGAAYVVSVVAAPAGQVCTIAQPSGTVSGANVENVSVTCATGVHSLGGSLIGLAAGASVVLQNNGADDLSLTANGDFTFPSQLAAGSSYNVTILTQPSGGACSVSGASGSIVAEDVTSIVVNCAPGTFTVGGSISGLTSNVVLQNNGGDNVTLASNGSFAFPTALSEGSSYEVTILRQPNGQTCQISSGTGTVGSADVTSVSVTCVSKTQKLGGTVSGLTGSVVLANNGRDFLPRNADGPFTFNGLVAVGSVYNVTIKQQPAGQKCAVTNGVGVVGDADITDVTVTCVSGLYSVGGTVNGLAGGTVVLQNNDGDDLTLHANGRYAFPTPVRQGQMYSVTVLTPPSGKSCSVSNGSGTIATMNVQNVIVSCQ
jgi:hypothetical protein